MTVISPHGVVVRFNNARYAKRHQIGFTDLYTGNTEKIPNATWVAQVPLGWLIEVEPACDRSRVPDRLADARLESIQRDARLAKTYARGAMRLNRSKKK